MMNLISNIGLLVTVIILLGHLLFAWINIHIDTFMFHEFAKFIRTGVYFYPIPELGYKGIITGSPPLYSVLLAILYSLNYSDIYLHVIQLIMLTVSGYLVYLILKKYLNKSTSSIIACLFILIPGNLVFATYVMSDLGAQFLFTIYIYLIFKYVNSYKIKYIAASVFVGFITGLWRYSFVVYGLLSLIFFILRFPGKLKYYIFPILGISIMASWIIIIHNITGVWGLSNDGGIRYNIQMMMRAKVLPQENHPAMIEIRKYIPKEVDLRKPYWELEQYILPYFNGNYAISSKIIGAVGKAAMEEYPVEFFKVSIDSFFNSHRNVLFASSLGKFGLKNISDYPPIYCQNLETLRPCKPIILTKISYFIWNTFIEMTNFFYIYIFPLISYIFFFPLLVWAILFSDKLNRVFAILFLIGRLPIAMATWPDPRYVLPFYPLMVLIMSLSMKDIWSRIQNYRKLKIMDINYSDK